MENITKDMIGKKGTPRVFPSVTIAGRTYTRPAILCNLDENHFCVLDNVLSVSERDSRLQALRDMLKPTPKSKRKVEADDET